MNDDYMMKDGFAHPTPEAVKKCIEAYGSPEQALYQLLGERYALLDTEEKKDKEEEQRQRRYEQVKEKLAREKQAQFESDEVSPEDKAALAEMDTFLYDSNRLSQLPKPEWLIEGVAQSRVLTRIVGEPKSLKSFMVLDMAGCIGTGKMWHGKEVHKAKVLYVVAEGATGTEQRVRAWETMHSSTMTGVQWYPRPVQIGDAHSLRLLKLWIRRHGFELVVFDTQARCTVGVNENDATEFGVIMDMVGTLQAVTGATVWLVHHTPIGDPTRGRGSNSVAGAVDSEMLVERNRSEQRVKLKNTLQKDAAEFSPMVFTYKEIDNPDDRVPNSLALTLDKPYMQPEFEMPQEIPDLDGQYDVAVLKTLTGVGNMGATQAEVVNWTIDGGAKTKTGKVPSKKTIREALDKLVGLGVIGRHGGRFGLTMMGEEALIDLGEMEPES